MSSGYVKAECGITHKHTRATALVDYALVVCAIGYTIYHWTGYFAQVIPFVGDFWAK
jgi:hypothetical protein